MVQDFRKLQAGERDELLQSRTTLVHIQFGADCSLFGGWGVRI